MAEKQITVMDILKLLNKSNCRECGLPTCMAFAAMVVQGQKDISQCPYLAKDTASKMRVAVTNKVESAEQRRDDWIGKLKSELAGTSLEEIAERIDAPVEKGRLQVRCLGKIFELDQQGGLYSLCHINSWVHLPVLNYAMHSAGKPLANKWVPFSNLKNAKDWVRFFTHRCEGGMQQLADKDPALFADILSLFSPATAKKLDKQFDSADMALKLFPLPSVPMIVLYWKAEGQFESKLSLLFDRSAEVNLGAESIYLLVMGLLEMLNRISEKHGAQ